MEPLERASAIIKSAAQSVRLRVTLMMFLHGFSGWRRARSGRRVVLAVVSAALTLAAWAVPGHPASGSRRWLLAAAAEREGGGALFISTNVHSHSIIPHARASAKRVTRGRGFAVFHISVTVGAAATPVEVLRRYSSFRGLEAHLRRRFPFLDFGAVGALLPPKTRRRRLAKR